MNFTAKNKYKKSLALLFACFLVSIFFWQAKVSRAADKIGDLCGGDSMDGSQKFMSCSCVPAKPSITMACGPSAEACGSICGADSTSFIFNGKTITKGGAGDPSGKAKNVGEVVTDLVTGELGKVFKGLIFYVFVLFGWLLMVAGVLLSWAADTSNVSLFLNSGSVRSIWYLVRDFLNMFFILVLLFASFCTIFQVDKWSLKKVWLNILINALLVNFSFTIARFIIDISNVIMYYFLNSFFDGVSNNGAGGIFASITNNSGIATTLVPGKVQEYSVSYLIAATIMVFVLAMTLLIIAAMLLIRLVALSIVIMFAPLGFVGFIFPSFNDYAHKWWKALFQYAMMGPIMLFFLMISLKLMTEMKSTGMASFSSIATQNTTNADEASFIASLAFFFIPIILLWIGIGQAVKGSVGGSEVLNSVRGNAKKLGNWSKGYAYQRTGMKGAVDKFKKDGKFVGMKVPLVGSDNRKLSEERNAAFLSGGPANRKKVVDKQNKEKNRSDIKDEVDKHEHLEAPALHLAAKDAIVGETDRKKAIENAAKAKLAVSGGRNYERVLEADIEREIKQKADAGIPLITATPLPVRTPPAMPTPISPIGPMPPPAITPLAPLSPTATPMEIEVWREANEKNREIERENLRAYQEKKAEREKKITEAKDNYEKKKASYEKEVKEDEEKHKKDYIREQKIAHMEKLQKIIQNGEKVK
jgi:hypothetical protein